MIFILKMTVSSVKFGALSARNESKKPKQPAQYTENKSEVKEGRNSSIFHILN